jgi:hypothetical protein
MASSLTLLNGPVPIHGVTKTRIKDIIRRIGGDTYTYFYIPMEPGQTK